MSSALDEDTRRSIDQGRETAGAMLRAAQKDLQKVFIVFLIGFIGTFYALRLYVWGFLKGVTRAQMSASVRSQVEIIAQTPFDVILLQAKIGLVVGVVLALPVFVYFARDALVERNMWPSSPVPVWKLGLLFLAVVFLFVLGVAYGYFVFFPFTFAFLANNALSAGFTPTYSIVKWAQFILLLTISFGLATQLPLAMTGLAYAEIVPYETFRDKWRHATVAIFLFGALFTPPDPFTQIMWATPVLTLYGISLYLTKVVVTAKRGSERLDLRRSFRAHWNAIAGLFVLGAAATYGYATRGGVAATNDLLAAMESSYRVPPFGPEATLVAAAGVGLGVAVLGFMYFVYAELDASQPVLGALSEPTSIDLAELDEAGVRAAPPEAFDDLTEDEAMAAASAALDDGDNAKAQAILDRFDEVEAAREAEGEAGGEASPEATGAQSGTGPTDELADRTNRAAGTFFDELTDGERDEDDVGGYYADISFIVDSLTSKSFRIAVVFGVVLAGTFGWLYTGGIGRVFEQFLSQLPPSVTPDNITVVALHPMEALIFEVKFSTLIAALVTLPMIAYYAWPALRERDIVRQRRFVVFGWAGALTAGLLGGFALGYTYVAPHIISYLVADALRANMIIAYRITNFFWLIFFTTAGIGLLADVPILMILLNTAGVSFRTMKGRWREVTVGILTFSAVFTPASITTMFLVTIPLMFAYGVGLGILFVVTLGGRRDLARPRTDLS